MAKTESQYPESKSWFKLRGIIRGKDEPRKGYGFVEATGKSGKEYRSLKFNIETSPVNMVAVELFGSVMDNAYFYNKEAKDTRKIAWNQRTKKIDGYNLIVPDYDTCEKLNEDFHDGDSVDCIGEIAYSTYHNPRTDKDSLQSNFTIKQLYKAEKEIDFDAEDFKEESVFNQEMIISSVDEMDGKLIVTAYVIAYGDKFNQAQFVVNPEHVTQKFYNTMKKVKFGTFMKVDGIINNRAVTAEQDEDSEWGVHVTHVKTRDKSLEIMSVFGETVIPKAYSEKQIMEAVAAQANRTQEKDKNFDPKKLNDKDNKPGGTESAGFLGEEAGSDELPFDL